MPELTQLTAEAECEYGSLFEAGLESRMLITLGQIGYLTKNRNDELKGRTATALPVLPPEPAEQPHTDTQPPTKKRKQSKKEIY